MERKGPKDPQEVLKASVMKEPTKFPKDAFDGVLLSMKENADSCCLDSLMEVCWSVIYLLIYLVVYLFLLCMDLALTIRPKGKEASWLLTLESAVFAP